MKKRKSEVCVVLLVISTVFWFAPFEIFFANINDFWFDVYELIPFALLGSIGTFAFLILLLEILRHISLKINCIVVTSLFCCVLALYIQGNYLAGELGTLDGTPIEWSLYTKEALVSYFLWGIVILAGILIGILYARGKKSIEKILQVISVCLIVVQLVTLCMVGILNDGFKKSVANVPTKNCEFEMSSKENMIVLILDSLDARAFERILEKTEYETIFEDFVWYRNTVGNYVYTDLSIPNIVSGQHYDSDLSYKEYMTKAYNESRWLSKLQSEDWKINIYTGTEAPQGNLSVKVDNYEKVSLSVSSKRRLAEYMYRLVGFRYLPFPLKQYCWFYPDEMADMRCADNQELQIYDWSNFSFFDDMQNIQSTDEIPSMHLYHLEGSHIPYHITKDFTLTQMETSLDEEVQGVVKLVKEFLLLLQEKEIYDNSTIVIMADHGFEGYRQSPVFCVKGKMEKHDLIISDKPLSYDDLQEGFCNLIDGMSALEAFGFVAEDNRKRNFYFYELDFSNNINEQNLILEEYEITGHSFDDSSVKK